MKAVGIDDVAEGVSEIGEENKSIDRGLSVIQS